MVRKIFKDIYNRDFEYDNIKDRKLLQSTIYILAIMGINVSDYGFMLTDNGNVYSLALDTDVRCEINTYSTNFEYSKDAKKALELFKNILDWKEKYDEYTWINLIAFCNYQYSILGKEDRDICMELALYSNIYNIFEQNKTAVNIAKKLDKMLF